MNYPEGFPREFQEPVDVVLAQSERTFQQVAKDLPMRNHRALIREFFKNATFDHRETEQHE